MRPSSLPLIVRKEISCRGRPDKSFVTGTHYPIAIYAIERGIHVLLTKPATQKLADHTALIEAAKKHNVVCFVEHHKR